MKPVLVGFVIWSYLAFLGKAAGITSRWSNADLSTDLRNTAELCTAFTLNGVPL